MTLSRVQYLMSKTIDHVDEIKIEELQDKTFWQRINWVAIAKEIFTALFILIVGAALIRLVSNLVERLMNARRVRRSVVHFFISALKFFLYFILLILVISQLGLETTSLVALVGSLGLAIGLALQGSLGDLASGIMLIFLHPIQNGDYVFIGDNRIEMLKVIEIRLFHTVFETVQDFRVVIPNSTLTQSELVNLSAHAPVRVQVDFDIAYAEDIDEARRVVLACMDNVEGALDYRRQVAVKKLGDNGVLMFARCGTNPPDYLKVLFGLTEAIKKALDEAGIEIPFPQLDVRFPEGGEDGR